MMHALLPAFVWFSQSWAGIFVQKYSWVFPAVEAIHIVALTVLFGAILFNDLQLLGLVRRDTSTAKLARDLDPWIFSSLILICISGVFLFSSEAMKLYGSKPFQLKIALLVTGLMSAGLAIFTMVILLRFGVLPMVFAIFVSDLPGAVALTTDFSAWYVNSMLTVLVIILAITVWSFRIALGGRKIWKADLLAS